MKKKLLLLLLVILPINVFASKTYKITRHDLPENEYINYSEKKDQIMIVGDEYYYDAKTKEIVPYDEKLVEEEKVVYGDSYYLKDDFTRGERSYESLRIGFGDVDSGNLILELTSAKIENFTFFQTTDAQDELLICTENSKNWFESNYFLSNNDKLSCKSFLKEKNVQYFIGDSGILYNKETKMANEVSIIEKENTETKEKTYAIIDTLGNKTFDFRKFENYNEYYNGYVEVDGIYYYISSYNGVVKFDIKDYPEFGKWENGIIQEAFASLDKTIYTFISDNKSYFIEDGKIKNNTSYEKNSGICVVNNKIFIVNDKGLYDYNTGKTIKNNLNKVYVLDNRFVMLFDSSSMYLFDGNDIVLTDQTSNYKINKNFPTFEFKIMYTNKENTEFYITALTEPAFWVLNVTNDSSNEKKEEAKETTSGTSTEVNTEEKQKIDEKYTYEYVEGANKDFNPSLSNYLIFKINGNYSLFKELYIDGKKIDPQYYSIIEGSTIIKFNDSFSNTLKKNTKHTLKVVYTNGKEVATNFTIKDDKEAKKYEEIDNPHTGVNISIISLVGLAGISVLCFKKKKVFNKI